MACLGVPDEDWDELAQCALDQLDLRVAGLAFIRVKNLSYLDFIQDLQVRFLFFTYSFDQMSSIAN